MPLPQWLLRIYYIFPIILYVPDVIFNYFVYSKGVSTPFNGYDITTYPENALWLFLALGIVGMAWLLSILAPWHWARDNKFQSVMCWFGVLIATGITTWNSLAYRMSQTNSPFPTDKWVADTFHITLAGFSPTTILVSISPPFWGLFWAIVQPSERRRSSHEEQQSHEARMLKIKLDAEMKAAKASASATVREAQLKGLAASVKAARNQMTGADPEPADVTTVEPVPTEESIPNDTPPPITLLERHNMPAARNGTDTENDDRYAHVIRPQSYGPTNSVQESVAVAVPARRTRQGRATQ